MTSPSESGLFIYSCWKALVEMVCSMRRIRSSVFFSGPGRAAFGIADVHNIPMVGLGPGPRHTAIPGNDVPAEHDQQVAAHGSGWNQGFLEPLPLLFYNVGITAVGIRVEVVRENRIRAKGILAGASRRFHCTERPECRARDQRELVGGPVAGLPQVPVVSL